MAKRIGFFLGPLFFAAAPSFPLSGLTFGEKVVLGLAGWMAAWWITEAVPIPATSLLPIVVLPLFRVMKLKEVTSSYADPIIFLFLGGFILARALETHGLHRRALTPLLGKRLPPWLALAGFMLAAWALSGWMSNTATTIVLLPVLLAALGEGRGRADKALLLGLAYAASIGGMATLVGTPPNMVLAGVLAQEGAGELSFVGWMAKALPYSALLLAFAWLYLSGVFGLFGGESLKLPREEFPRMCRRDWYVLAVFGLVVLGWLTSGWWKAALGLKGYVSDATVAVAGAAAVMITPGDRRWTPVLLWEEAEKVPWGVLILFGGGLALARGFSASGLSAWLASHAKAMAGVHPSVLVLGVSALVVLLTEFTSNTATAAITLPVLVPLAKGLGLSPLALGFPATIAASAAFMLPVATPPNAVVFASGRLKIGEMFKVGLGLDALALLLLGIWVLWLGL